MRSYTVVGTRFETRTSAAMAARVMTESLTSGVFFVAGDRVSSTVLLCVLGASVVLAAGAMAAFNAQGWHETTHVFRGGHGGGGDGGGAVARGKLHAGGAAGTKL